jgi:hypothetical protein
MAFQPSTFFQAWASRLRVRWNGIKGGAILRSFAKTIGDDTVDWGAQANLEHLSDFSSSQGVALIASERQLDTAPAEATSDIAARAPQWIQLGRFVGTPIGMLLGLHFSGFDGAVLITQNGMSYQLTLPLPPFVTGQAWDPTPNLVRTACSPLVEALTSSVNPTRSIPAGTPWFAFDGDTDFCSRFTVLFPGQLPGSFMTTGTATFTASNTAPVVWNNAFGDLTYHVQPGIPTITDGIGPISVVADLTSKSLTGVQLLASGEFTGTVSVLAWQSGANPFADLHPADLQRLKSTIQKWKPGRTTCLGVIALLGGELWDYPVGLTWNGDSLTWDQPAAAAVQFLGSF